MSELLLSAQHLTKRFGGLAAVNDVSVNLFRDRIHAVIGPNGAGKSTLTNLLSGIRVNEHRMRAVGYGTFGYKLAA
ncbi:MAG: ATP-binding cassette domain-containing protein, partial [Hydrogenophaga sp.]|nr:ATP-binding cassette domain-containing protein [Hydrogenophaga sp.]